MMASHFEIVECMHQPMDRLPIVHRSHLPAVLEAIDAAVAHTSENPQIEIHVGQVWDRKGYPYFGKLSPESDPSPYRGDPNTEDVLITVAMLLPRRQWMASEVKTLIERLEDEEREARAEATRQERIVKEQRITQLRAEADQLEKELET